MSDVINELKQKYGITEDDAIRLEVENSRRSLPFPQMGTNEPEGALLRSILGQSDGDLNKTLQYILVLDYVDGMSQRRASRNAPKDEDKIDKVLEQMKSERDATDRRFLEMQSNMEKLILGKELESTRLALQASNDELKRREELYARQQEIAAMREELRNEYEPKLNELREKLQNANFTPEQKKGFLDEVLGGVEETIKGKIREDFEKLFRGERPSTVTTDEEGKTKINYAELANRALDIFADWVKKAPSGGRPERKPVKPTHFTGPSGKEGATETIEPEFKVVEEEKPEQEQEEPRKRKIHGALDDETGVQKTETIQGIPTEEISGIGPNFSKALREELGVNDVFALSDTDPQLIAERLGVPISKAEDWVAQAKDRREKEGS